MNTLQFNAYDPKSPVVSEEFRVAKILYKGKKVNGELIAPEFDNACVLLPPIAEWDIRDNLEALLPHIGSYLESVQDMILKDLHGTGVKEFEDSSISINSIINKLESSANSARLNGEEIGRWFDATMAEQLVVAVADKMGVSDAPTESEERRINLVVEVYKKKLSKLASGKTFYMEDEAEKLKQAIVKTGADASPLGFRFINRLQKMIEEGKVLEDCFLAL